MWNVESATTEGAWFAEYAKEILAKQAVNPPVKLQKLFGAEVEWFESEPGVAVVRSSGASDSRWLAEQMVVAELENFGYRRAKFSFDWTENDPFRKQATWDDIMAKAKRLIQSGQVTLLRNGYNNIVAHVVGDHGDYVSEISRDDPNSRAITQWTCECPWDQYAFQRTRQWKKYEARPCAHVLAAYWKSLGTPLDEDVPPGQEGRNPQTPPAGTPQSFEPGTPGGMGGQGPFLPQMPGEPVPGAPEPVPGVPGIPNIGPPPSQTAPFMAPPSDNSVLPPFPGIGPEALPPISIPGGKPPTPYNPIQQPGTFSSWQGFSAAGDKFQNADMARLEEDTYGEAVGKGASGDWRLVPKNSIGEVMGQDPTTGWVEVNFPLKGGQNTPYHVRVFIEAEKLTPMPNVAKPGPFIRRR
jgi:hypothetical protein